MNAATKPPPDRDRGLALLGWFVLATVVMVGAVLVAAAVAQMWVLVPGIALHLLMTYFVLHAIVRLMAEGR
jgi:hypothetical protein